MKLLFVHIPKTGGTSILKKIDQSMWRKVTYAGHDPLFILERNNNIENCFSFCVVRNPFKRAFSYYNHFKKINKIDCSFLQFLKILKRKEFYYKTQMMVYPQTFYTYNTDGIIGVNKIYRYEEFEELENDFKIKFDVLNKGNYTEKDYFMSYTDEEISIVKDLFFVDFVNFGYDLNQL